MKLTECSKYGLWNTKKIQLIRIGGSGDIAKKKLRELGDFHRFHQVFALLLGTEVGGRCWDIGSLSWTLPWWVHLFWALEIRDFHSFHQAFWTFFRRLGISKVLGGEFLKLNANWIFLIFRKYSTSYGTSKLPYGPFIVLHKINCVEFQV